MGTAPNFAATPVVASGLAPATLDTSLTAPTNVTTLIADGGTNGTRVDELALQAVGTTAAGVVNVFLHDGSTYHLYDQVLVSAITSSTTALAWRHSRRYESLVIPDNWSLRFSVTVSGLQSMVKVTASGGAF